MESIHEITKIVPWQASWEEAFSVEKERITEAMAASGLTGSIYHVGSTSIKGMASKPIIDILVCPAPDTSVDALIPVLEQAGYANLGECGRPGRCFMSKGDQENETFYLHLCHEDHPVAKDQLLFQYIERQEPIIASSYRQLKKTLASQFPLDRNMYRLAKGTYVDGVLSAYRLGERAAAGTDFDEAGNIKYWVCEFEMPYERKMEIEAFCTQYEMTVDEFFESALLDWIRRAKADADGVKAQMEAMLPCKETGEEIALVRDYPVYLGETEVQARKRKMEEESTKL